MEDTTKTTDRAKTEGELRNRMVAVLDELQRVHSAMSLDCDLRVAIWELGKPSDSVASERLRGQLHEALARLDEVERERIRLGFAPF